MENRKIKYVIAPEGCNPYLTPGKKYEFKSKGFEEEYDAVVSDQGKPLLISLKNCAHLRSKDWIVVYEEEMSVAQIIAWVLFVIACVLSMCYLFSHRTNFQEVVPPYTDKGGSTLFIERP